MSKLWSYLFLPPEISAFERTYLSRLNRVALVFFWLHVPAFAAIAALNGNNVMQALVLTPIVLVGPTLVYLRAQNPRAVAITSGFTAMVLGGLLVHFGQGPMQIEMHFYFFVLIALLAVFGNPSAVLVAAVTVAVHHLATFLIMPRSVFNYDASVWTVVVHAAFVVLESVAAVFVARSFFDNVIGLEKIVGQRTAQLDERTREMRLVLENVGQGFVTVSPTGAMASERSAALATWLGAAPESGSLFDYIAVTDPAFAERLRLAWSEVFDGIMPLALTLDQMPRKLDVAGRHLELEYKPIGKGEPPESLLVVISDATADYERERAQAASRELAAVFERFGRDRLGFIEFYDEANELVRQIVVGDDHVIDTKRRVHTLKGNSALFGVETIAAYCHALETKMTEDQVLPTPDERKELMDRWRTFTARLDALLGPRDVRKIEVGDEDIQRVLLALGSARPASDVAQMIAAWRLEPTARRFARVAEQANRLAERVGKDVEVDIDDHGIRLEHERWAPFWSAFVHAVRNAVDHGVEPPELRRAKGKSERGHVHLTSSVDHTALTIEIRDDGRGVDWDRVGDRARALGLRADTHDSLVDALFADGLTTRDDVSDLSGRGVGLAALRAATIAGGGHVAIESKPGEGTAFQFRFPLEGLSQWERATTSATREQKRARRLTGT